MTTLRESQHQKEVADIMTRVSDTETLIEMQAVAKQYRCIRHALNLAMTEFAFLDEHYGITDHTETITNLREMLMVVKAEEVSMHDKFRELFGEDTETAGA